MSVRDRLPAGLFLRRSFSRSFKKMVGPPEASRQAALQQQLLVDSGIGESTSKRS
jgi:hypothetical protein